MTKIPTGYDLPVDSSMSDADIKAKLMSEHKQTAVKKSNFPTEIVPLPSKGLVYPEGHPLSDGTIEMKYMTAREEDILTSQNLIKQGVVLDKLFESLIVTPINYSDLYIWWIMIPYPQSTISLFQFHSTSNLIHFSSWY